MIYFDYAATSIKKPKAVIDAVVYAMENYGNSGRSAGSQSLEAARTVYEARMKISELFNCDNPRNVVFTSNATEALNIAINGILDNKDHVITTDLEHNSVLRPLYAMEEKGLQISYLSADKKGNINYEDLDELVKDNTKAVICTHASNLTGNVLDIEKIGAWTKKKNILFIVDVSQTAGVWPIDMQKMNIDVLAFTGHKALLGPQGTGGLCVREGVDIKPFKRGGTGVRTYLKEQPMEMPVRLEAGTLNAHGIAGLSAAIDYISQIGLDEIRKKEQSLVERFVDGIKDIDGLSIYGDFSNDHAAIVSINYQDVESSRLADALMDEYEIATRAGAHCAPRMHEALGTVEQGVVRFSFGYDNTFEEIDAAIKALHELCQ